MVNGIGISARFRNKIPNFLAHLGIWNDSAMTECRNVTREYKKEIYGKRECAYCGKEFYAKTGRQITCSQRCGALRVNQKRREKREEILRTMPEANRLKAPVKVKRGFDLPYDEVKALRDKGLTLGDIANQFNVSKTKVWTTLNNGRVDKDLKKKEKE